MADETKATISIEEKIARTRTLPIPEPSSIPSAPKGYEPTKPEEQQTRLKRVAREREAELVDALEESAAIGAATAGYLGKFAPSGERAAPIVDELKLTQEALSRAEQLVAYLEERKAILLSDGRTHVDALKREYDHYSERDTELATTFKAMVRYHKSVSAAISEGLAEAKKRKKDEESEAA